MRLFSAVGFAVALGSCTTAAAADQKAATAKDVDRELRQILAPYIPEIEETAQLMYGIGVCERFIRRDQVDFYIREYMVAPPPEGLSGAWVEETQDIYKTLYAKGRAEASKLDLDSTQCQRVIDAGLASVKQAVANREAAIKKRSQ